MGPGRPYAALRRGPRVWLFRVGVNPNPSVITSWSTRRSVVADASPPNALHPQDLTRWSVGCRGANRLQHRVDAPPPPPLRMADAWDGPPCGRALGVLNRVAVFVILLLFEFPKIQNIEKFENRVTNRVASVRGVRCRGGGGGK